MFSNIGLGALFIVVGMATALAADDRNECTAKTPSVHCGRTPTVTADKSGRLWVAYEYNQHIYVSHSDDRGASYSKPVSVNRDAETIYADGENRPKIAFGKQDEIYISWTQKTEGRYSGDIRFSRSLDGGKHFEAAVTINDDGLQTSHRFDSLIIDNKGHIYLVWLDKRDRVAAMAAQKSYTGAAVYYTVSTDGGKSFAQNRKIADNSCECCRISTHEHEQGGAALFWRHIFDRNTRDHAFAVVGQNAVTVAPQRATRDHWQIDACPHHGPALAAGGKDTYHMTWFTNGTERKGIYYGRYNPATKTMSHVRQMSASATAAHPFIVQGAATPLVVAWKAFDGVKTVVHIETSSDGGRSWQKQPIDVSTKGASDHPFLLLLDNGVYLSWHTQNEGLRVLPVEFAKSGAQS